MGEQPERARAWTLLGTYACLYVAVVVLIVASQRYLFADGSHLLLEILERKNVSSFYWARRFAQAGMTMAELNRTPGWLREVSGAWFSAVGRAPESGSRPIPLKTRA